MEQTTTEQTVAEQKNYSLGFHGTGGELFGIIIVNWLLTVITLGFYYPWAKAKQLSYMFGATSLNNDRFAFHGTGKEMFKGFIKALIIFVVLYGILIVSVVFHMEILGGAIFYIGFLGLIPLAIHGTYKYRMSRTSWRGIRFGYRGERGQLLGLFIKGILLTVVTIGIYGSWFAMNLRNYIFSNIKFGNIEFKSNARGSSYFVLILKGYFLSFITLGIYSFWWMSEIFAFYVNNISMHKDDREIRLKSTATGVGFLGLILGNLLIIVFTLGLGFAWTQVRTMNFIANNIELEGNIDLDSISQTEEEFTDATGEDVSDFLDLDITL
jgi:uncharacterized membrane protein YjgN (DUF898 family)